MNISSQMTMGILIVVAITILVYWIQTSRAKKEAPPNPIYIAKPDWYVSNMEWQPNTVLYGGENYYYSTQSQPK